MAVLLAIVGGLGLTTTMSINVLERIREIGVLRAIGASDGSVRLIILAEGMAGEGEEGDEGDELADLFHGFLLWFGLGEGPLYPPRPGGPPLPILAQLPAGADASRTSIAGWRMRRSLEMA